MEDDFPLEGLSNDELAELAASSDLWHNVPALSLLADRDPDLALSVARPLLHADDEFIAAAALRVVAALDTSSAHTFMQEIADDPSPRLLDAMVEILAVDLPVDPSMLPGVLQPMASRLASPRSGEEQDLAILFFRQYPQLQPGSSS
jgi:hypothetical protein